MSPSLQIGYYVTIECPLIQVMNSCDLMHFWCGCKVQTSFQSISDLMLATNGHCTVHLVWNLSGNQNQNSVAWSVIQVSGMVLFEDTLKAGTLMVGIMPAASVWNTTVINLRPHGRSHFDLGVWCGVQEDLILSIIGRPNGHVEFQAAPEGPLVKKLLWCSDWTRLGKLGTIGKGIGKALLIGARQATKVAPLLQTTYKMLFVMRCLFHYRISDLFVKDSLSN